MLEIPAAGLPWEVSQNVIDAGSILRACDFAPIQDALARGEKICAVRLPGFGGLLIHPTQSGVTFAREFADRVRVVACVVDRPFLIHSDIKDYGLNPRQWRSLRKQLKADAGDALVVVWAPEEDAPTAVRELFLRAQDALQGVPAETRQAFDDGTNGFERILPGPDRMYPDTDTPPIPIPDSLIAEVQSGLPETPWDRERRYGRLGLKPEAARLMARSSWADLYDALAPEPGSVAVRIANALNKRIPPWLRRSGGKALPATDRLAPMVRALESEEIRLEATEQMLDVLLGSETMSADEVLDRYRKSPSDLVSLDDLLKEITAEVPAMPGRLLETLLRWGMGKLMRQLLGKLDPKLVAERLSEALRAELAGGVS